MNLCLQHVIDSGVDQAMTREGGHRAKRLGDDAHPEMALAAGRAGVAGMVVGVVVDLEQQGGESLLQPLTQSESA